MKVQIKRDGETLDIDKVKITIDDVEFRISQNKFGQLVVNKYSHGESSSSIIILPNVSNEITIM